MSVWVLAFRNLLRNRRRSSTTLLAMIVGLTAILLFGGYARNINYGLQTSYVRQGGHLQIQHRDYFLYGSGDPVSYGIDDYRKVMDTVRGDPELAREVTVVTPVLAVNGIAGNFAAGVSRTVSGSGIVVADQNRMRQWNDYGFADRATPLALTGSAANAVVIGTGVARVLRLCDALRVPACRDPVPAAPAGTSELPADIASLSQAEAAAKPKHGGGPARLELLTSNAYGAPNVAELSVIAAQKQGVKQIDDMFVQMRLAQAQQLVYGSGPSAKVTSIVVQLKHTADLPAARARIQTLLRTRLAGEPLEVLGFATLNPQYGQVTGMFGAIFGFISILIATIVLFTVGNTMNMAVMERTHEIGTLRALGLRDAGIRRLFVCEGCLLGICGAAAGTVLALAAGVAINRAGLHWTPPGQTDPVALSVRVWGEFGMIARYALGVTVVATLSAWLPAHRAARLPIVEALRFA
ncbi:ABC transporter permease [Burkholderia glumae]|uniref:ABC transporter permease n=1 Tax=Burkholderia glumae TaxID=337 RepID=UPI0003A671E1|nr:FtsX-like permease family protein [Burkholderia glumae]MCM2493808.1 FtsX-like permease family protein [Burkholderia glumae]MCM2546999.1 FtsX-like permease family protein [Burkholderia glumae]